MAFERILQPPQSPAVTTTAEPDGRTRHYGSFYGVDSADARDERPALVVWGNCQAEALRIVLNGSPDLPYRTVRVPPVHELTEADMPHVRRVLAEARVIAAQPIRAGYRGLPIGTADVAAAAPHARTVVWPVIRYGGLYPFQLIVRHPSKPSAVPAGVPYHDLRTVLAVREGRTDPGECALSEWDIDIDSGAIVAAARWSIDELARRERRYADIAISDVLLAAGAGAAHTVNHPGNAVLTILGTRILDAIGGAAPLPPARELLGNVRAPLEGRVLNALGIDDGAVIRQMWKFDGEQLSQEQVRTVHMRWYADNPEFIDAALMRYAPLMDILGIRL